MPAQWGSSRSASSSAAWASSSRRKEIDRLRVSQLNKRVRRARAKPKTLLAAPLLSELAVAQAREMGGLSLADSLSLCELRANVDPPRYQRAALRWLQRFIDKRGGKAR